MKIVLCIFVVGLIDVSDASNMTQHMANNYMDEILQGFRRSNLPDWSDSTPLQSRAPRDLIGDVMFTFRKYSFTLNGINIERIGDCEVPNSETEDWMIHCDIRVRNEVKFYGWRHNTLSGTRDVECSYGFNRTLHFKIMKRTDCGCDDGSSISLCSLESEKSDTECNQNPAVYRDKSDTKLAISVINDYRKNINTEAIDRIKSAFVKMVARKPLPSSMK